MTSSNRTEAVLYESAATLRLVDQEIHEFSGGGLSDDRLNIANGEELLQILDRTNQTILHVSALLREAQVAAITADSWDRASEIVDELDAIDAVQSPDRARAAALRNSLRVEIAAMKRALVSHDSATPPLRRASALLAETEHPLSDAMQWLQPESRQAPADEIFPSANAPSV